MISIDQIRRRVREYGEIINAPLNLINIPDKPIGDGSPHVEITESLYNYVISERGIEHTRRQTKKIDDLLYWIFSDIASAMSFDYELKNRISDRDCRRLAFDHRLRLLGKLNKSWKEREAAKIRLALEESPYVDSK